MVGAAKSHDGKAVIIERLLGERGEENQIIDAARAMAARVLTTFSEGLNEKLASPVEVDLEGVDVARMADAKPADPASHALTIASSPLSPDTLVMAADAAAVAILVNVLFGADEALPPVPIERPFTPTELDVANLAFKEFAQIVNGWGERSLEMRFPLPSAMTGEELKRKVLRDGPAVRLAFSVTFNGSKGAITVFMPQRVLMHRAGGAEAGADWRPQLNAELMRSSVALKAVLPLGRMTLGEIGSWREGEVIPLPAEAQSDARLLARDKTLFVCEFGKLGQNYTVRVRQPFDAGQDFLEGLMLHRN